jgi:transcriptional regulator with GAF, ATPase, and Fis domain
VATLDQRELSQTFADIARALLSEDTVEATLQRIVDLAVETVEGCECAGITFVRGGQWSTPASTSEVPPAVDSIQYETGEGPCLDAIREHEVFQTDDLSQEERWPRFAPRAAAETAVVSMLCFRLFVEEDTLGALNLYAMIPAAFDDDDRAVGSVFAAHAAVALSTAQHDHQMEEALRSRDTIGQAKGILMARQGVTADEAFDMLRRGSQRLNIKLRQLAQQVTDGAVTSDQVEPPTG